MLSELSLKATKKYELDDIDLDCKVHCRIPQSRKRSFILGVNNVFEWSGSKLKRPIIDVPMIPLSAILDADDDEIDVPSDKTGIDNMMVCIKEKYEKRNQSI